MVLFRSKCKKCSDLAKYHGYYCSMKCSIKGNKKIIPNKITPNEFSRVLLNNIGITVSRTTMYNYIREIKSLIND